MELVPAPSRHLKTVSFIIAASTVVIDIAYILIDAFNDQMEPETLIMINAGLAAAIKIANLFKQNIAVTTEQKKELVEVAKETNVKETK